VAAYTVMKLMGHASLKTTERYMHLSPNVSRDAVLLLDQPAPVGGAGSRRARKARPDRSRDAGSTGASAPSSA
jgi:hypothetical protein